jgi:hypothetical protein
MTDTSIEAGSGLAPYASIEGSTSPGVNSPTANRGGQDTKEPSTARQAASGVAGQVKERLVSSADSQKAGIADRLDQVADSLNRSSEQFAGKQDWIAGAIARGGSELGTLASSLRDANVADLLRQVQGFARRRPGMFIGASLVAGFALARFGKIVASDISRDDLPAMPEVGHGQH